jgi:hypothetical protein
MNLALNGFTWRTVLRAAPEPSRPEILGTLTECYGVNAPLGEAFRTFTSGSRMHNRASATSPVDLWREAARNAVVFLTVFIQIQTLGSYFLPRRYGYSFLLWSDPVLAVVLGMLATLFLRGRCTKTFIGLTFLSQAFWFASGLHDQIKDRFYGVGATLWTAAGIFITSCAFLFLLRRRFKAVILVMAAATVTTAASEWFLPHLDGTQLLRSRNGYALFAASQALGSLSLLALATFAAGASPISKPKPRWWPMVLSFGLALSLSINESSLVPEHWTSSINRSLGALVIGLLTLSLLVATARPQLILAFGLIYVVTATRFLFLTSFSDSDALSRISIAPVLIAIAAIVVSWQAARRALRM